jgi:hypothetical protein
MRRGIDKYLEGKNGWRTERVRFFESESGSGLIEIILAMAVFALMASALLSLTLGSYEGLLRGGNQLQGGIIADEGVEALRSIRERGWNQFQSSSVIVTMSGTRWVLSSGASQLVDSKYTRAITLSSVCRDASRNIVDCPGSYTDIYTKKAIVTVSWTEDNGVVNSVTRELYLTNWSSANWIQTNWIGGSGQSIWSDATKYYSADNNIDGTTAGDLKLANMGSCSSTDWHMDNGSKYFDTTDTDFNRGTYQSNTAVSGTGADASVVLTQNAMSWQLQNTVGSHIWYDIGCTSATSCWAVGEVGGLAYYNGTTWTPSTVPSAADINGIYSVSTSDIWAVGASGRIWHYNGSAWSLYATFSGRTWADVVCTSSTNCWVIGDGGYYSHFTGSSWGATARVPSNGNINGIFAISASDIWAVGASGKIWHYDGSSWIRNIDTGGTNWEDIACTSSTDCWVAGDGGDLAHYTGSWATSTIVSATDINDIYANSASDIWAVGNSSNIWHYDGSSWSLYQTFSSGNAYGVTCANATACWMVTSAGKIYWTSQNVYQPSGTYVSRVFDGGTASAVWDSIYWDSTLPTGSTLTIATRTGNTAVPDGSWTAWSSESSASDGTSISVTRRYIQYRASLTDSTDRLSSSALNSVRIIYNVATTSDVYTMWANSTSVIWAGTTDGKILHYNGTSWTVTNDFNFTGWYDIACNSSGSKCWAVGNTGDIAYYNGSNWTTSVVPSPTIMGGVWVVSDSDVWAVGANARIWHYNGTAWSLFTTTSGNQIWYDVTCSSATNCWAVGAAGALARYNGTSWTTSTIPSPALIWDVKALSASDVWAVGDSGRIWHYNGTSWSLYTTIFGAYFKYVSCSSSTNCNAVGDNGMIVHWSGTSWAAVASPTSDQLYTVATINNCAAWIGGANGILLTIGSGTSFAASGVLISSAYNMGAEQLVQAIEWDETKPAGTDIRLQIRTAPDASGSPGIWSNWRGAGGDGTYFTVASGTLLPVDTSGYQWVQYRAELTGTVTDTPVLGEVRVNY